MPLPKELAQATEYNLAAIDALTLKNTYALWGENGLMARLKEMGPERAAKAEAVMKAGRR